MSPRADGSRRRAQSSRSPSTPARRPAFTQSPDRKSCISEVRDRPQLGPLNPKEINMEKLLAYLMLGFFVLGSSAGFAQVPEKCKGLQGDAQKKCIDDAKKG
jgi:hypothetical protein